MLLLNSARNIGLVFNYLKQAVADSHCHIKYSNNLTNKMQPSITAFFKAKPPQGDTKEVSQNDENKHKENSYGELQILHPNIGVTWFKALQGEFEKPYFKTLSSFVQEERKRKTVFPPPDQVFTWTHYHAIKDTRVVILGQDPYHGPNQAHGLSFSVQKGIAIPKSLMNIYKELESDVPDFKHPGHGDLTGWSKQGVLLLNACLTVNKGEPNSHSGKGWETFTDAVISWISKNVTHSVVFILWGKFAQKKSSLIAKRHKILISAHPSPLSVNGFFGCKHFSQTNAYLKSQKLPEIDWAAL